MRRAVFLDRDDTLIANREITARTPCPGDLFDPDLVRLLPGAARSCLRLRRAGFALVLVSNQGAVARGFCTVAQVEACNQRLHELLKAEVGIGLDAVYYCPFHPRGSVEPFNVEHPWRKPAPGMFLAAAQELGITLSESWAVGDNPRDTQAAVAAGIDPQRALLIGEADGARFADLADATDTILGIVSPAKRLTVPLSQRVKPDADPGASPPGGRAR